MEGFLGGLLYDCLLLLCLPVTTVAGVATASSPSTVEQIRQALESAEVKTRVSESVIARVAAAGERLTAHQFKVAGHIDVSQQTAHPNSIELIVKVVSVGIVPVSGNYGLSLTIQGRVGSQLSVPFRYEGEQHELSYWTDDDAINLRNGLRDAMDEVAEDLIRAVFLSGSPES